MKHFKYVRYKFRCFMTDAKTKMLVLEDLRAKQFKIVNSALGLDAEHLKLTLSTLAKWHAGNATLLLTVKKHDQLLSHVTDLTIACLFIFLGTKPFPMV